MFFQLVVPGPIEDVEEVRVLEWHGAAGKSFAQGGLVVELETHKAVVEVRTDRPVVLRRILAEAGGWEKIGRPLALLSDSPTEPEPADIAKVPTLPVEFDIS